MRILGGVSAVPTAETRRLLRRPEEDVDRPVFNWSGPPVMGRIDRTGRSWEQLRPRGEQLLSLSFFLLPARLEQSNGEFPEQLAF